MLLLFILVHLLTIAHGEDCKVLIHTLDTVRNSLGWNDNEIKKGMPRHCNIDCNAKGDDCAKVLGVFFGAGKIFTKQNSKECEPKEKGVEYLCHRQEQQQPIHRKKPKQKTDATDNQKQTKHKKKPDDKKNKQKQSSDPYYKIVARPIDKERHTKYPQPGWEKIEKVEKKRNEEGKKPLTHKEKPDEFKKTIIGKGAKLEDGEYFFVVRVNEPETIRYFNEDEMCEISGLLTAGHSSFLKSEEQEKSFKDGTGFIIYAGEFVVEDGVIVAWSNVSGHFLPFAKDGAAFAAHWGLTKVEHELETTIPMLSIHHHRHHIINNDDLLLYIFISCSVFLSISFVFCAFICGVFVAYFGKKIIDDSMYSNMSK